MHIWLKMLRNLHQAGGKKMSDTNSNHIISSALLILIITLLFAFVAFHPLNILGIPEMPEKSITIGVTLPFSGSLESFGKEYSRGINLASEEINKNGGINGIPVNIEYYDNRGSENKAKEDFIRIYEEKIPVIIGPMTSKSVITIAPFAEIYKVIIISPGATSAEISDYTDYIYRTVASDAYLSLGIARILNDAGFNKAMTIYLDGSYGSGLNESFCEEFEYQDDDNLVVASIAIPDSDTANYDKIIEKINETNPDSVFLVANPAQTIELMKKTREAGFSPQWIGPDIIVFDEITNAGASAEGTLAIIPSKKILDKSYIKKYEDRYHTNMKITDSIYGYDTMILLAEIIRDKGYSVAAIKDGLDNIRYLGSSGTIVFDENGDRYPTYDILRYTNGTWKTLNWGEIISLG